MLAETVDGLDEGFVDVKDLEKMRTFYTETLGFEEEFSHEGWGVGLRTGQAALVLTASAAGSKGVSLVFGCRDIERSLAAVSEKDVPITSPVTVGHWGAKVAGFEDPEGNTIHLEQPAEAA